MDLLEKIDMFTIDERRGTMGAERAEWMKGYETLLKKRGDHQAGKVDWNTATYMYNTGISPEQAVKKMVNSNPYK
jgi:hypothetical protein